MPLPKQGDKESRKDFLSRCMSDPKVNEEFPDNSQRFAVCNNQAKSLLELMDDQIKIDPCGEESEAAYIYEHPRTGEMFTYRRKGVYKKNGVILLYKGKAAEALQYGKPKKKDPRKTPAKPSERKRGSKKNPPKSASKPSSKIKFSKTTEKQLEKIVREHNEKIKKKGKGHRASIGRLKSVYRRGAGAFSTSHAPKMSRHGWAMARVRAFLFLLRNEKPSNPNYKQDNDLLPKSHPRSTASLWDNIRKKKEKEGKDYKPAKPGDPDRPSKDAWKRAQSITDAYLSPESYKELKDKGLAAIYQGRKVELNQPFRTPDGPKKFSVYVKNEKDNVVKVNFGDPDMEIKRDDPKRRKSFRARHNCDSPGPKWKARYWSCWQWRASSPVKGDE